MTPDPDFDSLAAEAAALLSEYLRVPTVNPPGNETLAAEWLRGVLQRDGIAADIFESSPGRGNLYARVRGTGARRALILLSHSDVVPVTASAWSVDPFGGVIRDGYVWGRGALDMKGIGIVELVTLLALRRRGVPLARDLVLIVNADEEAGSTGAAWFTREKASLIADAELLINEGGSNRLGDDGRMVYYGLAVTEKLPFWLRLTARGTPGHASQPRRDNAVARLVRALARVADWETPLQLTAPAERYLRDLAAGETNPAARAWLADPAAALASAEGAAFLTSDRYHNAMVRNTVSITALTGSDKTNVIPPVATAELDVRLLPGVDPEHFLTDLRAVLADDAIEVSPIRDVRPATSSPLDGEMMHAVRAAVEAMEPGALVTTPMLAGYTDSPYYRALGIHAYGLSPFRLTQGELGGVHGNDERVSLENLRFGVEYFYRIVERLAG
ncbi:MAG: M20/M25/M40 family metallo-hydrolase [Gemmatimonadota bacterium]|nr:M20/M25/M40 family metallo-hydrolase [Gemmatimonadota bacterium]